MDMILLSLLELFRYMPPRTHLYLISISIDISYSKYKIHMKDLNPFLNRSNRLIPYFSIMFFVSFNR